MKKIVLISLGQPSTNPRMVKEANTLAKAGFDVYVVYAYWTKWAWDADQLIFRNVNWKPLLAGGSPFEDTFIYFLTRLRAKIFKFVAEKVTVKFGIAEIAQARAYPELLKKTMAIKADLYIAHIQAALPVAVKAARKHNAKSGFDVEDFHRQEITDDINSFHFKITKYLEDKYLPKLDYLTTASPLISIAYKKLYPQIKNTVINNVFESDLQLKISPNYTSKLRLFWFSQTIGRNRGLEDVVKALQSLTDHSFELYLLGHAHEDSVRVFTRALKGKSSAVYFIAPMSSDKIIGYASHFDIGLALETGNPLNRDICLTNKIFTYIQSGLAVIASNTAAQTALLNQYPAIGKLYKKGNYESLADILLYYQQNRDKLFETRNAALLIAHEQLNWENESQKFLSIVKETLSKSES